VQLRKEIKEGYLLLEILVNRKGHKVIWCLKLWHFRSAAPHGIQVKKGATFRRTGGITSYLDDIRA